MSEAPANGLRYNKITHQREWPLNRQLRDWYKTASNILKRRLHNGEFTYSPVCNQLPHICEHSLYIVFCTINICFYQDRYKLTVARYKLHNSMKISFENCHVYSLEYCNGCII